MFKDIHIKDIYLTSKTDCDYWIDYMKDMKEKLP